MVKVGEYYYKIKDKKIALIRIKKINSSNITVILDEREFKITKEDLEKYYTLLKPHGSIFINIVKLHNNTWDVIVSLFREIDMITDGIPYAVCRQNIHDFLSKNITDIQRSHNPFLKDINHVGLSLSKDTCPLNVDYNIMVACDKLEYSQEICIYINDNLNDIINLVNKKGKIDSIISSLYNDCKLLDIAGCSNSLKSLLIDNMFMDDFYRGFNIYKIDIDIKHYYDDKDFVLSNYDREYLENISDKKLNNIFIIKYNYDININDIKRDNIIVKDINNEIYIIGIINID